MKFHELEIEAARRETPDAVALSFAVPPELEKAFAYRPGQYLTLRHVFDGLKERRSYSIASEPGAGLMVAIKKVEGGRFSTFAQGLKPGDRVEVAPPEGRFVLGDQRDILLVAAGSGITPMVAIASHALAAGARVTLVYGNRDTGHIMFREAMDALKDKYLARFTLIHVLSREEQDVPLLNGRINGERLAGLARAGAIDMGSVKAAFLCGPGEMIEDVETSLRDLGLAPAAIHQERFTTEGEAPRPTRSRTAQAAAQAGVAVEVILDGTRRHFMLQEEDDSVLAAATRQGLELPYSCKGGMCCTCRCRITEGAAEMATNYSLEPWEQEAGFTLACQARPTTPRIVLDFDAA